MPPKIKCRTCKIAKQVLFIQPVNDHDEDAKTVLYIRIGIIVVLLAMAVILW